MDINERVITFKFLHNILTTKNRLFKIKKIDSPLCPLCNSVENQIHMFVECKKIENILVYFKYVINKICNLKNVNINKILHLNFKANKNQYNTAIILTTAFIGCVWYNRGKTKCIEAHIYKTRLLKHNHILQIILKENMAKLFTENYCKLVEHI